MIHNEILEYPYNGTITRIVEGTGDEDDEEIIIYDGVMDEHMTTDESGGTLQTSSYIISIPLTKDENGLYIIPFKGDKIHIVTYGDEFTLSVDNSEISQIGGISVYASRNSW